ncbi:MAG TPA: hypothetical protein VFO73_01095 [Candidatus Limnocylindrales bacterium]|nr:hypothetical protein [Candidatus Limnocylindrales bacterium]
MTTSRREAWISGLVIGAVTGLTILVLPMAGAVIALVFAILVRIKGSGVAAAGGFGVGCGASLLALLIRGIAACEAFDSGPGQGCTAPDLSPWLAAGVLALGSGVVLTAAAIAAARRARRASAADQRG